MTVTVKNIGTATWIATGANPINIGAKWNEDADYGAAPNNIPRVSCISGSPGRNVAPGTTVTYTFTNLQGSSVIGTNNLTFDVVEEGVSWFGDNSGVGPGNSKYISPAQTIVALPTAVTVTGAGTFCGTTTLTAANGGSGTIYFEGTTSGGTSTATPASSAVITTSGTYYFRAQSAAGCWGTEGSAAVTINPLPAATTVTGAGTFCSP